MQKTKNRPSYIIIGSYARGVRSDLCNDLDVMVPVKSKFNPDKELRHIPFEMKYDIHPIEIFDEICDLMENESIMNLNESYTLLASHLFWKSKNGKYKKYMEEFSNLQRLGCKIIEPLFDLLYSYWLKTKGSKDHIKVYGKPEDFFTEKVDRSIPHDELHKLVAFNEEPAYKLIQEPLSKISCSQDLFEGLSWKNKDLCVVEEVIVTAIERNIGFKTAYVHLLTSMTKGWFSRYILERAPYYLGFTVIEDMIDPQLIENRLKEFKNERTKINH